MPKGDLLERRRIEIDETAEELRLVSRKRIGPTTLSDMMDRRPLVGIIAIVMLGLGISCYAFPTELLENSALPAICVRVGMLMAALWLAMPEIGKLSPALWFNGLLILLVIACRPRAAIWVIPTLIIGWMLRPRSKPS